VVIDEMVERLFGIQDPKELLRADQLIPNEK
jgi:hypothetical protein